LDEARAAFAQPGRNVVMAGGLDLIDRLKAGEPVDRVIHLAAVDELSGIRQDGDTIVLGALTTHADVARDSLLADVLPDLSAIWRSIANPRVRHAGTLGGNLMSGMPHYDAMPALLALNAEATFTDRAGNRSTSGLDRLAGRSDIILERVRIPAARSKRLLSERSLHPTVSVYLGVTIDAGFVQTARIVVGCAYARPASVELPIAGSAVATLGSRAAVVARDLFATLPEPLSDG
jgi:carbon-monoxide dehydrogenase medium subunit